jgi:Uma2 family endonuclease
MGDVMSSQPKTYLTPEEYLALEREAEFKSEFYDGEMFMMSGASRNHCLIVTTLVGTIGMQLRGKESSILCSNMRVHVPSTGLFTYPDVIVVGEPKLIEDGYSDTLLNPTFLIEVLSPSTENYDRGKKFEDYRSLESLQEYLLVAQDECKLTHYTRQTEGSWLLRDYRAADTQIELASINCHLSLTDVYDKVAFS